MTWRIHNVDMVSLVFEGGILRLNRNPFFLFEIHRVHDSFFDLLICPESARLPKQLVHQGGLSMINMGYNCNITYTFHRNRWRIGNMAAPNQLVNEV